MSADLPCLHQGKPFYQLVSRSAITTAFIPRLALFVKRLSGGAGGIRTPDFRLAKAALSPLSYGPTGGRWWTRTTDLGLIRTAL